MREEDVMIADGYPIPADQSDGCYVVLFAIQPNEPELCMGSGSSKRRKRSILEIHRKRRQLPGKNKPMIIGIFGCRRERERKLLFFLSFNETYHSIFVKKRKSIQTIYHFSFPRCQSLVMCEFHGLQKCCT